MVIDGAAPLILENCSRVVGEARANSNLRENFWNSTRQPVFNLTTVEFINILQPPKGLGASNRGSNYLQDHWNALLVVEQIFAEGCFFFTC
jgi:hypothetical protein